MKKKIFIIIFIICLSLGTVYAANQNSLGSNVKAALTQEEDDLETAYLHFLDATKSDHTDPSGYMKYIKLDIDGDSKNELITITTNEPNGKTLNFYSFGDTTVLFLGKKDFKDASYPMWFFQDKCYIVIDDTVEGFFRVQLKEGELKITEISDYPVDKDFQLAPLLYEEPLPSIHKDVSALDEKVQAVLNDETLVDLKTSYKALFNSFVESTPVIVDQEEETTQTFDTTYLLYDINNDNVSELIVLADNAYFFTFNNGLLYLGSIYFQNSIFEGTSDNYLTVLSGNADYFSYIIKMTTTNITLEHTYSIQDTDFNPYSKKALTGIKDTAQIDNLQNNPTKSVRHENSSSKTLPIAIGVSAGIVVLFVVGLILYLKFKK